MGSGSDLLYEKLGDYLKVADDLTAGIDAEERNMLLTMLADWQMKMSK